MSASQCCGGRPPIDPSSGGPGARVEADARAQDWCRTELPGFVRPLVADLEQADAFELHARLLRAALLEQRMEAEAAPLLAAVAGGRLYRALGHPSLDVYVRERLGMSPRKARALLRLERAAGVCPALRRAWQGAGLSWVRAHALVPVLLLDESEPWREAWIAWAAQVSVRRLEEDVEAALLLRESDPRAFAIRGGLPDRQTCARPRAVEPIHAAGPDESTRFFFTAPTEVARLFRAVLCSVRRRVERRTGRLPTRGEAAEILFDHALAAWGADDRCVRSEHRVFERDGWRCSVPGCSSFRNLHAHHVVFRSAGGSDDPANLTVLCAWHHQRGVHAGRVRCRGRAPDGLRFELGLRDGLPPLVAYGPGERLLPPGESAQGISEQPMAS